MSSNYTPPPGAPPSRVTPRSDSLSTDALPDEPPPPPYTPAAGPQGDTSVQAGPSHVDFSGPAPRRPEQNITGVGVGYGRRPDPPAQAWSSSSAQHTGRGGWGGLSPHDTGAVGSHGSMQPPPTHPSRLETSQPTKGGPSSAGSSRPPPPNDVTPTEAPTPGRPLLHHGMMLIYPQGYFCSKCGNTGYRANDPSNPCSNDWRKYGKPYNSALAHSYTVATGPTSNPSTSNATNFQRPLPNFASHSHPPPPSPSSHNPYGHLPPPPGKWDTYPGQHARPPPSPMRQPQSVFVQHTPGPVPHGAVVVAPGDPRIGGR